MNRRTRGLAAGVAALGAGTILIGPITALAQSDDDPEDPTSTTAQDTTDATTPDSSTDTDDTDDADDKSTWLEESLQPLIDDGTLTQAQADAVIGALREARPFDGHGPRGHAPGRVFRALHSLDTAAEAIGITTEELRDALADGQTLAEVAEANGVAAQTVIDALVAEASARLGEAVAEGRIDQAEADERRAELTERITTFVNEGLPAQPLGDFPRRGPLDDDTDEESTEDEDAPATTDDTDSTEAPTTTTG